MKAIIFGLLLVSGSVFAGEAKVICASASFATPIGKMNALIQEAALEGFTEVSAPSIALVGDYEKMCVTVSKK